MARYTGPVCKLCRREGEKLFLKGERCNTAKCSIDKRSYAPGQHGPNQRIKLSEYGRQLREKQKAKRIYGILEKQFRNYYKKASRMKGVTGENLLKLLESRLDNVVFRLGFAPSRNAARQLVLHRHFLVNGKLVNIPSYLVKSTDNIEVKEQSKKLNVIHESLKNVKTDNPYPWLEVNKAKLMGTFTEAPTREQIPVNISENLIVELYSK